MKQIIAFYMNKVPANDRVFYLFDDIVNKWTDYRLQVRQNYINWLFPLETDIDTKLTSNILYQFRKNQNLRLKVSRAVIRMMFFFGYSVDLKTMQPIRIMNLKREENNVVVGLYNPDNYSKITRILHFLTVIKMPELSALFFLMLCSAMHENPDLQQLVNSKNVVSSWIKTQPYLETQRYPAEEAMVGTTLEDWEKDDKNKEGTEIVEYRRPSDAWEE